MDLQSTSRSFTVGGAFAHAFGIIADNFVVFTVIQMAAWIALGAVQLLAYLGGAFAEGQPATALTVAGVIFAIIAGVFWIGLSQALGAYGGLCRLEGRKAGLKDAWSAGWRYAFPSGFIVILTLIATYIGTLFFIFPGILVAVFFCMTVPALVIDKAGFGAFGRSAGISENYRFGLFGFLLLSRIAILAGAFILYSLLMALIGVVAAPFKDGGGIAEAATPAFVAVFLLSGLAAGVVISTAALAFGAAAAAPYVSFRQKAFERSREKLAELFA
ncbi:MAG TPA: hypothetical protein PLF78_09275 [Caulobacter sp.]|nr:hypothetical protein [Caulobacter sp.]